MRDPEYLSGSIFKKSNGQRLKFNVGGQVVSLIRKCCNTLIFFLFFQEFEVNREVLLREPRSLLAALCSDTAPLQPGEDGVFFIDRDWYV